MPLQFQSVAAPMSLGLAENIDTHHAHFGTLMTAENARWTQTGRVEKRRGYTALASVSGSQPVRLFARGAELSSITSSGYHYTYSAAGAWNLHATQAPQVTVTTSTALDTVTGTKAADVGILSDGTQVYAWITGSTVFGYSSAGSVYVRTVDTAGNETLQSTNLYTGTAQNVRVLVNGTNYIVMWTDAANLYTSYNAGAAVSLRTDVSGTLAFDAMMMGSTIVVAYAIVTGGIRLCQYSHAASPTAGSSTTVTSEASTSIQSMGIDVTAGECLYVVYHESFSGTIRLAVTTVTTWSGSTSPLDLESAITTSRVSRCSVVRRDSVSATAVWYTDATANHQTGYMAYCVVTPLRSKYGIRHVSGLVPCSKPWNLGSSVLIAATTSLLINSLSSGDALILDITAAQTSATGPPPREVAKVETLTAGQYIYGQLSQVPTYGSVSYYLSPLVGIGGATSTAAVRQGARLVAVSQVSATDGSLRPVRLGPEVYLSGGVVSSYDGDNILPGWAAFPPYVSSSTSTATTGGTLAAGTYILSTYAERRNQAGVIHRGPTAIPRSITTTGTTSTITMVVTPVWAGAAIGTSYDTGFLLPIYMTTVGGSILQRLTVDPIANMLLNSYTIANGDLSQVITSTSSPFSLATRPAIYTASGELDDYQPPSSLYLAEHQNRLWSVGPDGRTVWFSKDLTLNPGVAPGFNPALTLTFADPIVALASMDSALVAFTATGIYAIQGDGPAPNGQNATYQAVRVQTDVGCSNARSVVSMPDGVMFQSSRGLYLIDRGLVVSFAGKPVQTVTSGASVTNATLVAKYSEIRFALSTGTTAVFNYVEKQWSTYRYSTGSGYGRVIVDACIWNGAYTMAFDDGTIGVESDASYLDGATWVPMTLETSWYNAGGPLKYQSVRTFQAQGVSNTAHGLTISVGFDNEDYAQSRAWASGSEVTTTAYRMETFEVSIGNRRKCQSIRFKVADSAPSTAYGTGAGPSFDSIAIQVGIKRAMAVNPATNKG